MRVATCLLLVLFAANKVVADDLTFTVTTDKAVYNVGETVQWQTAVSLSNVQDQNFGILSASFDLADTQGVPLSLATISAAFADYTIPNSGIAGVGTLQNVGVGQFGYNAAIVEVTAAAPGPTVMATGSFLATVLGPQTLAVSPRPDAQFFNVQSGFGGIPYANSFGSSVNYNVAVPEPSSLMLSLLGMGTVLGGCFLRRRANRKKQA